MTSVFSFNLKHCVESLVYESEGRKMITLDGINFSKSYLFLGWTRGNRVVLGDIIARNPEKIIKHFGNIVDDRLQAEGSRFSIRLRGF